MRIAGSTAASAIAGQRSDDPAAVRSTTSP
jgi:hypothetical protein